jgi:hypothetical protein
LNIAVEPPSLSVRTTVPAEKALFVLPVVPVRDA